MPTLHDEGTDVRRVETSCIETDDKFYGLLRISRTYQIQGVCVNGFGSNEETVPQGIRTI